MRNVQFLLGSISVSISCAYCVADRLCFNCMNSQSLLYLIQNLEFFNVQAVSCCREDGTLKSLRIRLLRQVQHTITDTICHE